MLPPEEGLESRPVRGVPLVEVADPEVRKERQGLGHFGFFNSDIEN